MNTTDTSEKGRESIIEHSLMAHAGYRQGKSADYDKAYCVDRPTFWAFLQDTQLETVTNLGLSAGSPADDKFLKRLFDQITQRGIADVLRKGVKHGDATVRPLLQAARLP